MKFLLSELVARTQVCFVTLHKSGNIATEDSYVIAPQQNAGCLSINVTHLRDNSSSNIANTTLHFSRFVDNSKAF